MISAVALASSLQAAGVAAGEVPENAPNGIAFPVGYEDWQVVSLSHRNDNNSLRVILGNDVAVRAARNGQRPWPKGSVLAKVVWKDASHAEWVAATVPGRFVHVEIMVRDRARFPYTGGWGFARWVGKELKPYGTDDKFVRECYGCHEPVADTDYVFTRPVFVHGLGARPSDSQRLP